jgi:alcohol dehydrogenase, propanol-preferring
VVAIPSVMRAWRTDGDGHDRLRLEELPVPVPAPDEVLVQVRACGVCRTDLHVSDGDLPRHLSPVVPGHEVVGEVVGLGPDVRGLAGGDRVGIAWLRETCGACRWCRRGAENLCLSSRYTGWDEDGGYAEYAVVPADFAYRLPGEVPDVQLAPLLCAGIIGYRALHRAQVPPGGRLGIYGFGASAHLTAQVALARGAEVHVLTRDPSARRLALELGAAWAGAADDEPPERLDSAIVFAPAGELVPVALAALDQGGTLAVAGIHLSDIPGLDYQRHLFRERTLTSVTSNTRADGEELLTLAGRIGLRATVTPYPFERAAEALHDLSEDRVSGAAVLTMNAP